MKKTRFVLTLVLTLAFSLLLLASPALGLVKASPQSVTVDGALTRFEVYNIDGSNYFKLRDIAYALRNTPARFSVGYDPALALISLAPGRDYTPVGGELQAGTDQSATAKLSRQSLAVNGLTAGITAYNIGGNNFFQLRALGLLLGFNVDFDPNANSVLIQSGAPQPAGAKLTPEQIYARCAPAVFYLEVYDGQGYALAQGSGFFLNDSGLALTNYHVIQGAASASATLSANGDTHEVLGVYSYSETYDLALIQVQGSGFPYLAPGDSKSVAGGAKVYALGSPMGLESTISEGLVSNPARLLDGLSYIQTSAPISPGSSGGALLNEYGQVIAVTAAIWREGQNLNLAIPLYYQDYLEQNTTYSPLASLPQAKAADPWQALANYLMAYGAYDAANGNYYLELLTDSNSYYIYYVPGYHFAFANFFASTYGEISTILHIPQAAASYEFSFSFPHLDIEAGGTVNAANFRSGSDVTFRSYNGAAEDKADYRTIAGIMLADSLAAAEYMLAEQGMGVSIADFGFQAMVDELY